MQIEKRPLVRRQHQYAVGQAAQVLDGIEPVAQWVGQRLRGMHADGGSDARQHLVAGNQQAVIGGIQAGMLRRVPAADDHLPVAATDVQAAAFLQTAEMVQWRRQEMGIAHHREHLGTLFIADAGLAVEVEKVPARWLIGGKLDVQRLELADGHVHRAVKALREPRGHAGMVRVKVRADHRQQWQPVAHFTEHPFPDFSGLVGVHAGVYRHPAIGVTQQIEVDVVQAKRQRHAQPPHARRHFAHLPGVRRLRPGVPQAAAQFVTVGVEISHGRPPRRGSGRHAPGLLANRAHSCGPVRRE
ncbi:hypothetical protein D3C76_599890 [compost metagenome]